jgi:hypothetical protein
MQIVAGLAEQLAVLALVVGGVGIVLPPTRRYAVRFLGAGAVLAAAAVLASQLTR